MAIAVLVNRRNVQFYQFAAGGLISVGMVLFAVADCHAYPSFNYYGISLVTFSVVADAFLPNIQERVFENGASRTEVTFYTNSLSLVCMTLYMLFTGELAMAVAFTFLSQYNMLLMLMYTILAYVAIYYHMTLVQEFGGISAVLVGNVRKVISIVLSFLVFPKPFSWLYVAGGVLVFGGLVWSDMIKEQSKGSEKRKHSNIELMGLDSDAPLKQQI
jgi:adenosine 3'-phospho 5'-phosphosulfate transporter B3